MVYFSEDLLSCCSSHWRMISRTRLDRGRCCSSAILSNLSLISVGTLVEINSIPLCIQVLLDTCNVYIVCKHIIGKHSTNFPKGRAMKHYNLNRICDRPHRVTFVAGALCARGNGHNAFAPLGTEKTLPGGAFCLKEVVTVRVATMTLYSSALAVAMLLLNPAQSRRADAFLHK